MNKQRTVKVAVVQAAPEPSGDAATLRKIDALIREAASTGAKLVLFPEAFVPGYPRGASFGTVTGSRSDAGRERWRSLCEQSVEIPGPLTEALGAMCREHRVFLGIGVIERDSTSGTLYCSLLLFDSDGRLVNRHRKIKPTGSERLIWGEGDASGLRVVETPFGRIGGLVCWENYMPLARAALYAQGVEIYLAPTADARDSWQATLRHIACEGRSFVLGCNQFVTKSSATTDWTTEEERAALPDVLCRGGSAIVSPLGECLAGPIYDREEVLLAELDLDDIVRAKLDFDPVGHYSRPDLFELRVRQQPWPGIAFKNQDGSDSDS